MAQKPNNWNQMSPEDRALWEYINAGEDFTEGGAAVFEKGKGLQYDQLNPSQLAQLQRSGMADISTDPALRNAQLDALRQLEEQSQTGMTARDEADLAKLQQDVNRNNRGRIGAIQQNMAARGMSGSGMDLIAQMQSSQDAADREALAALEKNAQMMERKDRATMQRGDMAGAMRSQDFGEQATKAQAQDAINRFNAANQVNQQQANWQAINQARQANWNRQNQTTDNNTAAQYDYRKDKLGVGQGNAQMQYNKATEDWNRKEMEKQAKARKRAGLGAAVGGVLGGAAGAYFGGPAGAAAGYQMGSSIGQNYAYGGKVDDFDVTGGFRVPGIPRYPYDTEADDTVPAMLSPGEIVVPKTVAQDPSSAAAFAAKAAAAPSLTESYKARMGKSDEAVKDAQGTQDILGMANIAGKLFNDYSNSQKQDVILKNRMQDLGRRPDVIEAKRKEYDGSMLDRLGSMGVDRAEKARARDEDMFWNEQKLAAADKEAARDAEMRNPNSGESVAARAYLKKIAPNATTMDGFDGLSAAQIAKIAPGIYKAFDDSRQDSTERYKANTSASTARRGQDLEMTRAGWELSTKEGIAGADRTSREKISGNELSTKERISDKDRAANKEKWIKTTGNVGLTEAEKAADREYGKNQYTNADRSIASADTTIATLDSTISKLNDSDRGFAGRAWSTVVPSGAEGVLDNEQKAIKQQLNDVVLQQAQLMKGALSDGDRRFLESGIYDPTLTPSQNAERLQKAREIIAAGRDAEKARKDQFEKNGTIKGASTSQTSTRGASGGWEDSKGSGNKPSWAK